MTETGTRTGNRAILVAGAGIPGLTFALALKRAHGPALDVSVCDPSLPAGGGRHRGRAFAIAAGGRRMFERLGLWPRVEPAAQAIHDMVVSDSRLADPVRPVFLTFAREHEEAPFAHMVEAEPLVEALLAAAVEAGIGLDARGVSSAVVSGNRMQVRLSDGGEREVALLVAADGARSRVREAAGIGWVGWFYPQSGIVATIQHERDHEGRAYEHFLPSGPFAILPLRARSGEVASGSPSERAANEQLGAAIDRGSKAGGAFGHRSSIVWTERAAAVAALTGGGAEETLSEIERRFGLTLGRIALEHGPSAHPLAFGMARGFRAERLALLGDAAHVIHPVAGQGLNLGLSGAAALAEAVTEALRLGMDPGAHDVLAAYERTRRFDTLAMAAMTDGLNRLFSNDLLPLRLARDLGLGLVDRMPGLKRFFIGEASALRGEPPRLMRGEAL